MNNPYRAKNKDNWEPSHESAIPGRKNYWIWSRSHFAYLEENYYCLIKSDQGGKLFILIRESVCILVKAFLEGAKKKGLKSLTRAVQHCCKTFELKLSFPPTGLFLIGVEIPVKWKFSCSICGNIVWVMASLTSTDRISCAHVVGGLPAGFPAKTNFEWSIWDVPEVVNSALQSLQGQGCPLSIFNCPTWDWWPETITNSSYI